MKMQPMAWAVLMGVGTAAVISGGAFGASALISRLTARHDEARQRRERHAVRGDGNAVPEDIGAESTRGFFPVSYTHLTLPTNREG